MLKIKILAVGNIKEDYLLNGINEYKKRLSRFASVEIQEVQEFNSFSKTSEEKIKEIECERLMANLEGYVICLDKGGCMLSSEELSQEIKDVQVKGFAKITFVIGGSFGLTKTLLNKANKIISFGKITYPHQLMRLVLMEQIYRAETIINNITYHK